MDKKRQAGLLLLRYNTPLPPPKTSDIFNGFMAVRLEE